MLSVERRPASRSVLGARYQLLNELGHGGMGTVYRALDRLSGRVVTLKRMLGVSKSDASFGAFCGALAREFQLLASLRHPNITNVLDYGFDEDRAPYFTMDLEESAQTIIDASRGAALAVQIDLLVQVLRALAYLHRLGIVHCDLKPGNILVVRDQVKVLDFGLSVHREAVERSRHGLSGTLAYMAPETLRGEPASERSDLYAVGMVAYEMLLGRYPFDRMDPATLYEQIVSTPLPRASDEIDARLRPVIESLLSKDPRQRPHDAAAVVAALSSALNQTFTVETVATRESFLQAAPFVGRSEELARLTDVLSEAKGGRGSVWLVAGESGVGKTRILDELRTQALVGEVVVMRGQAANEGGDPYHGWRDVVANLSLRVELEDEEAGVLKTILPDIGRTIGRDVPDPVPVSVDARQTRLFMAVDQLLRRQPTPVLIVLEDLQWVGSESLELLSWLAQEIAHRPALVVGSFRDDDRPDLPSSVPGATILRLGRLDSPAIRALARAMMGDVSERADLIALVERETEGIPFFIVEVVRDLAEHAKGLDRIGGASQLPEHVLSGGMQRLIRRRLGRVAPEAFAPLVSAAVVGRALDLELMAVLHPAMNLEEWTARCAAAAVLELRDSAWAFSHDKLREQLLADIPLDERARLHARVASALEASGHDDRPAALAHHWREAREPARELPYVERSGTLALQAGACREAVGYLHRALELLDAQPSPTAEHPTRRAVPSRALDPTTYVDPDSRAFRLGRVEGALAECAFRLGDVTGCLEHGHRALIHFGQRVPSRTSGWMAEVTRQALRRGLQTLKPVSSRDPTHARRVASEIGRVEILLGDAYRFSLRVLPLLCSSLRVVNLCSPAGPSPELACGYVTLALITVLTPARRTSLMLGRRAVEVAEAIRSPRDLAFTLSRTSVIDVCLCRWAEAEEAVVRAQPLAEKAGDIRLMQECNQVRGVVTFFSGRFEEALELFRRTREMTRRSGDAQVTRWALLSEADTLVRLGRPDEALERYDEALPYLAEDTMETEFIWALGMMSLARLRTNDKQHAFELADQALTRISKSQPVAYWTQHGIAATAEVFLSLLETSWAPRGTETNLAPRAAAACAALRRFARRFPMGVAQAHLWQGVTQWFSRRREHALRSWHHTVALSERMGLPFEGARAHLEIGRRETRDMGVRRQHLAEAERLFRRLGCATELAWTRAELSEGGRAAPLGA